MTLHNYPKGAMGGMDYGKAGMNYGGRGRGMKPVRPFRAIRPESMARGRTTAAAARPVMPSAASTARTNVTSRPRLTTAPGVATATGQVAAGQHRRGPARERRLSLAQSANPSELLKSGRTPRPAPIAPATASDLRPSARYRGLGARRR